MLLEQREDFFAEPTGIAKFYGPTQRAGRGIEKTREPRRIDAPVGWELNQNRAEILKGIKDAGVPILVVTGDADEAVPVTNTRMWVDTIKELGMNYEYVEQPCITHGPVITTSQEAVFAFFAKHTKK